MPPNSFSPGPSVFIKGAVFTNDLHRFLRGMLQPAYMTSRLDPRYFQMGVLGLLLTYGIFYLGFDMTWPRALLIVGTTLATQYLCSFVWKNPFDYRSALISGFSLSLFLRTNHWELAVFAAVITILSKFTIRVKGKHLFNPTN